jgi:hypothetical protein
MSEFSVEIKNASKNSRTADNYLSSLSEKENSTAASTGARYWDCNSISRFANLFSGGACRGSYFFLLTIPVITRTVKWIRKTGMDVIHK